MPVNQEEKKRIVVVEDEAIIALELEGRLLNMGYDVVGCADSADAAIALAEEKRPDLVLMDIRLRGERSGIDAAEEIRSRFGVPVVFLTAHSDPQTLSRAKATSPYGYLIKPFRERELAVCIDMALFRHSMVEELRKRDRQLLDTQRMARLGSWAWNIADNSMECSPELFRIFGVEERPCIENARETILDRICAGEREALVSAIGDAIRDGSDFEIECHILCADGKERCIYSRGETIRDASGVVTRLLGYSQDITERRWAEEAQRESEALSMTVLNSLTAHIAVLDKSGTILMVNDSWRRFALENGGNETSAAPVGLNYLNCGDAGHVGADRSSGLALAEHVRAVLGGEKPFFAIEYPCEVTKGRHWFAMTVYPSVGARGGAVVSHEDITERKTAELLLRESEDRYRDLVEYSGDLIYTHDLNGRLLSVNLAITKALGYAHGELLDMRLHDLVIPEATRVLERYLSRVASRGQARGRMFLRTASGEILEWEFSNTLREVPGAESTVRGMARDVTGRAKAERALRRSEGRFRVLTEISPVGIFRMDREGRCEFVNQRWSEITGLSPAEALGEGWWAGVHPEDREGVVARWNESIAARHPFRAEYRLRSKAGIDTWVIGQAQAELSARQEILGYVGTITDVSELKRIEAAARHSEARFRAIFESSPVPILIASWPAGRVLDTNAASLRGFGFERNDLLNKSTLDVGLWNDVKERERLLARLSSSGLVQNAESTLRKKDGTLCTALVNSTLIVESGETRLLSFALDITERKRTEDALRLLSAGVSYLRGPAFFERIAVELARLLEVEFGFVGKLLPHEGVARIVTLGMSIDGEVTAPLVYDLANTPCEAVVGKQPAIFVRDVQSHFPEDGLLAEMGVVSYAAVPLFDSAGNPIGHVGVMGRRHLKNPALAESILMLFAVRLAVEMERQRSERMFHDLFELSPDAIIMVDDEGRIEAANQQAVSVFRYPFEELIRLNVDELVPEAGRDAHRDLRKNFLKSTIPRAMGTGRSNLFARRKGGEIFPADISLSPIDTETGRKVIGTVRDITEMVAAQQQVRQSLAEKDVLLKEIHHRVKNNLQIISSLLSMRADTMDNENARGALLESQHRVRAMALIHERLYQTDSLARVAFAEYIRSLSDFLRSNYATTTGQVALAIEAEEVLLGIDTAIPMGLILNELFTNAFKHAFAAHGPGALWVSLRNEGENIVLRVADNGPGLPQDFYPRKPESMGWQLINTLARQLRAEISITNEQGAVIQFTFKEL